MNFFLDELFAKLREYDFCLTVDDYQDVFHVLTNLNNVGIELENYDSVGRICRNLWVKSYDQREIFERCFDEVKPRQVIRFKQDDDDDKLRRKKPDLPDPDQPDFLNPKKPDDQPLKDVNLDADISPDTQIPTALKRIVSTPPKTPRYKPKNCYVPASLSQMRQNFSRLNRSILTHRVATEVSINATLDDVRKNGEFFDWKFQPPKAPAYDILLLIDRFNSMTPFHELGEEIKQVINKVAKVNQINCYYFMDSLNDLYSDPDCWDSVALGPAVFGQLLPDRSIVLIFSDAEAAKRRFHQDLWDNAEDFLTKIKPLCQRVVWLNPIGKERWPKTAAPNIGKIVKMFALDALSLQRAIEFIISGT